MTTPLRLGHVAAWVLVSFAAAGCSGSDDDTARPPSSGSDAGADASGDATADGPGGDVGAETGFDVATDTGSPAGQRCDDANPCPDGWVCEEGTCHVDCGNDARCDGEVCCDTGDVCYLGACTTPGEPCEPATAQSCVPARCGVGEQCDPTIGKCMPVPAVQCEYQPEPSFDPVVLWRWEGSSAHAGYDHAIATPAVVDLDGDGASDIVVPVSSFLPGGFVNDGGILCALSGVGDCEGGPSELWCTDPAGTRINATASPAVADLEGAGDLTIVVGAQRAGAVGNVYGLVAFNAQGQQVPGFGTDAQGNPVDMLVGVGAPAIADLDGDGKAEVFVGYTVFDSAGKLLWSHDGAAGNQSFGPMTVAADLDGDGRPEIVGGNMAYHADGTEAWAAGVDARTFADGWPAVADFDADGVPEVAVVSAGTLRVFDATGMRFSSNDGQVAGYGGPPTVADVDGDGRPDVAVAGSNSLTVFKIGPAPDHAITQHWQMPSRDFSSNFTGSSVFDFEGDGRAEVIYGDECFARVYDGQGDGQGASTVRFEVPNTSCTGTEYPVVADVTGDGKAEFVVVANDYSGTASACAPYVQQCVDAYPGYVPTRGVAVYRDLEDNWVATRPIWNQHSYHVTNVCDGIDSVCPAGANLPGAIPVSEEASWGFPAGDPLNAYRVNARLEGKLSAPDLVPRNARADLSQCPGTMTFRAEVTNLGAIGAPAGIDVAFYVLEDAGATRDLVGVVKTKSALLPGASETVSIVWSEAPATTVTIEVSVDDDGAGEGTVNECDETNNTAEIEAVCQGVYGLGQP